MLEITASFEAKESIQNQGTTNIYIDNEIPCGTKVNIAFSFEHNDSKEPNILEKALHVGKPLGVSYSNLEAYPIPDNDEGGVVSRIEIDSKDYRVSNQFKIWVNIEHPYRGDLSLSLTSPSDTQITLLYRQGNNNDDIRGIFPDTITPKDNLSLLLNEELRGLWQLKVIDHAQSDSGVIKSWGIEDIPSYECFKEESL